MPIQFKEHLLRATMYKGGSTRADVVAAGEENALIKLSSNENPLGASPLATKAIMEAMEAIHEYQHQDDRPLREALARHFGGIYEPEQFVTANGGTEFLDMVCEVFVNPGDECIISSPCFMAYASAIEKAGGTVVDVPLSTEERVHYGNGEFGSRYNIDVFRMVEAVKPCTKLIFLCSPNNPTGSIIYGWQLEKLCNELPDHVILVMDQVYHQYCTHAGQARIAPLIKEGRPIIGMHSFSKAYGLAGLRLGFAFSTRKISDGLQQVRRPFMINCLTMAAGIAALDDQEHINRTVEMAAHEKQWLYSQLYELGIKYWPSQANFILFRSPYPTTLLEKDMLSAGILIRTGEVFKAPGCIRVTIGSRQANIAFISALKVFQEVRQNEGLCDKIKVR